MQSYTFFMKLLLVSQKRITFVFVKYYVKCYQCGRVFRINVQRYGVSKYRCPDCGNVVPFLLVEQGGGAMPVVQAKAMKGRPQPLPRGEEPKRLDDQSPKRPNDQSPKRIGFWRRLWSAFTWLFHIIVRFLRWVVKKIRIFREKYEDADLWLFFGFSFLFIVGVIFGLWLMAQITILLSDVHSWFFQMFLKLKFMF